MNKKNVLLVDNSLYTTGSLHSILQTTAQLNNSYNFFYVLPSKSTVFQLVRDSGFEAISLPMLEISKSFKILLYLPTLLINTIRLLRIIKQKQIDIIHINDIYNMLGVTIKIFRPRQKVVYYVRLLRTSYIRQMYPMFATLVRVFADNIICVSVAVQKDIYYPKQSEVIYTTFINEHLPLWSGLNNPEKLNILYLGNYMQGKGQQWAVYAVANVIKVYPMVHLHFVGGVNNSEQAAFRNSLQGLATELNVYKNITFDDPTNQVEKAMKNADMVLNLSESESFSMICLEAISYGVPLVTSDCGGPAEITDHGKQAFLVPNKNYEAAANAIIQVIEQSEMVKQMAKKAKQYAEEKFDPHVAKRMLERIYG